MAENNLSKEDLCVLSMQYRSGGGEGQPGDAGDLFEGPVSGVMKLAEQEEQGDSDEAEQWKEVARTIEPLDLGDGTEVDRIIRSTFEKPSGKRIELVFAEAQEDVAVSDITTEV